MKLVLNEYQLHANASPDPSFKGALLYSLNLYFYELNRKRRFTRIQPKIRHQKYCDLTELLLQVGAFRSYRPSLNRKSTVEKTFLNDVIGAFHARCMQAFSSIRLRITLIKTSQQSASTTCALQMHYHGKLTAESEKNRSQSQSFIKVKSRYEINTSVSPLA